MIQQEKGMHSIRSKITALTIIAIITTVLCVLAVSFFTLKEKNDRESVEMMNLIAQDTKKSIGRYTESIEQSVEMAANIAYDRLDIIAMAESGLIGDDLKNARRTEEQVSKFDRYLTGYCKEIWEPFSSVASHTNGVEAYYFCISPEISKKRHGFYYSRVGRTGFHDMGPIDTSMLDKKDMEHNVWWFDPIKRGRPLWVGPYKDYFGEDRWIFSYVVPVYNGGSLIGVLGMDIPFETIISQVSSIKVYKTGFASLISEDYRILYHPDIKFGTILKDSALYEVQEVMEKQDSTEDDMIRYHTHGQVRQLSFCTFSNGMRIAVIAPEEEINAGWTNMVLNIIIAAVLIILLFTAIIRFIVTVITDPILQLADASRRFARGDYDVKLDYKGKDEIGILTMSFIKMRDQIKSYIADLNHRIYTDDLTGLPNIRYFFALAPEAKKKIKDNGGSPVMVYINLIGMKHFNRQYGYGEGNDLICALGEILKKKYGEERICRLNQDRFAAVTSEETVEGELQELFQEMQSANNGKTLPIHVGIYRYSLGDVNVDIACDNAKYSADQHRGTYNSAFYYFNESMQKQAEDARYIINHIDQALEEHWIKVYYQPIIFAASGGKSDEEALSRWIDPDKGMLPPDDFIPYLENAGVIYKLDLYVLDEALRKMNILKASGEKVVPISVNLSRTDFDACDMVEEIRRRVDKAGIGHDMISIEITESIIGSDFDFMKKQVERFQKIGFPVWMDDFGSGYSTLDVLQDIHFDLIKLDMRFMQRFNESEDSRIIVTELIRMAIDLGVDTICEGVETGEEVGFLRNIGCTKFQGYYYGKPAPFEGLGEDTKD